MGGGTFIRTANISGFSGFRNHIPTPSRAEQAASRAARPVSAIPSPPSNEAHVNSRNGQIEAALLQKPSWVLDEWEFGELFDSKDPPPRVVFVGVPTIEKTREAMSYLKDALEHLESSPTVVKGSTLSEPLSLEHPETKACVTSESAAIKSEQKPTLEIFHSMLKIPEVQNVAASLVTDENVWNAAMKNKKMMEFYHSQQRSCALLNAGEITEEGEIMEEGFTGHGSAEEQRESLRSRFARLVNNVKLRATKMVSNLSDFIFKLRVAKMASNLSEFFPNVMESPVEEHSLRDDKRGVQDFINKRPYILQLVILIIMVVLLKRI